MPSHEQKEYIMSKELDALNKIDKILRKKDATGEEIGTLFLLSSAVEMMNHRHGVNTAPVGHEQLQCKVNGLLTIGDKEIFTYFANLMNTIRNSYNLAVGYKTSAMYRLSGLARVLDNLKHTAECVELAQGKGKYTKTLLLKEAEKLNSPAVKTLEAKVLEEARFTYAHNIFIDLVAKSYNIEELEIYKLDTAELEDEISEIIKEITELLATIPLKEKHQPQLNTATIQPTAHNVAKAEDFIKDIKNYNNISPTMQWLYILMCEDEV